MFTGIIEEIGIVEQIKKGSASAVLTIRAEKVIKGTKTGDSIAVNGVCLTVTSLGRGQFDADVMHETLNRSALRMLAPGSRVNLERAMPADGRFGGHIVAGHVDGTGQIIRVMADDNAVWYTIRAEKKILRYVVEKGSVAIDGISLTVAKTGDDWFAISAIPHTIRETTLQEKKQKDLVNLETDVIGKYVEKLMMTSVKEEESTLTEEFLMRCGF